MDAASTQSTVWSNETLTIDMEEGMQTYAVRWRLSVVREVSSDHMFRVLGRFEDKHIMWSEFSDPHTTWSDFPNRHTMIKGIRCDLEELKRIVTETDLSDILPLWSNEYVKIYKDCDIHGARRRCLMVIWHLSAIRSVRTEQVNALKELLQENCVQFGLVQRAFCIRNINQALAPLTNLVERATSNNGTILLR